jgi:hypothetical protein
MSQTQVRQQAVCRTFAAGRRQEFLALFFVFCVVDDELARKLTVGGLRSKYSSDLYCCVNSVSRKGLLGLRQLVGRTQSLLMH